MSLQETPLVNKRFMLILLRGIRDTTPPLQMSQAEIGAYRVYASTLPLLPSPFLESGALLSALSS
jgi:hypothetical protein